MLSSPSGFEQQLTNGVFVGFAGHYLDHPPDDIERDIVVRELRARRGELRQRGQAGDELRQCVVALTEIPLVVAQPTRAVVQALPQRESPGGTCGSWRSDRGVLARRVA